MKSVSNTPSPNRSQPVAIEGDNRVFLCGKTGSGKTFWAMHMLAPLPRLVVIDLKHSDEIGKWPWREPDREAERRLVNGKAVRVRVQDETLALYWLGLAYDSGGCVSYVDEINLLVSQGARSPVEIQNIWRAGREREVGGWVATQRPSWLPKELISEAEWLVMFKLKMADDRKTMADNGMGSEVLEPITDEHGFFISRDTWDHPQYYPALSTQMQIERPPTAQKEPAYEF